ncbi:hypothetical protein Ddye_027753 [Dipteronia dyeriana]|uniref:Hapless 8 n=1 Tax=Dipteronia dyeriana TaxID=168575 RepID=A0AAD9TQ65_9ROSI|nr:hypothetical protein Ddye_027753 [Dipteronia dyeriana]
MLSIENPPPDPSCSCQLFTQLKNTTNSDENNHKLALPELDLLNPPLDHHNLNLPKFSIRDYVFTSRSKDIKKNWPFSLKNLQLCLKHGVKDVLPPFQALGSVKIQSCTVDETNNSLGEKKNISNFDGEPSSGPNNNALLLDSSNNAQLLKHKLQSASIDTSSCRSASAAENDFPSTTTSVSLSEIESVRPSSSPLEPDTLLEAASVSASASVEAAVHPSSRKTENTIRPSGGKKCRLIVKFGSNSDRSSNEDIASNSTAVSETMASKVCPVCKIFTSSSNTTLNAHIDQCLSAESPPKLTADSKLTRHRIKPRKSRLMEDIYVTARHCTLEELDRRNGTNWATVSSLPLRQDNEKLENMPGGEVKRQRMSQLHPEDAGGEVGEVYIDSTGTKLRILSKSNDAPPAVPKEVEDLQPMKEVKESKFLSTKKKKRHARKHLKYLKLAPQSRNFFSHKTRASQICGGQEGDYGLEESGKKEKHQSEKQINSNDCGTLRQWVCSKRTGLAKKVNNQDGHQPFRCKWHLARDLLVENHQSSLGESIAERNRVQKYANLSENPTSSPEISEKWERSSGRKRAGSPLLGARLSDATERSLPQMKQNGSKDNSFIHGSLTFEPSNSNRNCVSSFNNKRAGIQGGPVTNSDTPPSVGTKSSFSTHAFASKALRTLSRKNGSSVSSQSSVIKSKPTINEKYSARKKAHVYLSGEVDEEVWHSQEVEQQYALMCIGTENLGRGEITDKSSLESSQPAPQCYGLDERENTDPSTRVGDDLVDKVDVLESIAGNVTSSSKSVDTNTQKLSNRSRSQSNSLHSIEDYNAMLCGGETLTCPTDPSFVDGEEMYCSGEVGNVMIRQNAHTGPSPGSDPDIGQGNSFPEVDPIPIPGPPGSFLPSPRDMGSDDFQGNSSLTTSRVQSSQDQLDLVDGDSSDSPISATSTIFNSTATRSDLKYSEPLSSVEDHAVQDKMRSSFCTANIDPSIESATVVPQTGTGAENTYFDEEKFKFSKISIEKKPLSFKNDSQPCCCQRKERVSQDIALNYQESQLLKRRTMSSVSVPAMGKQIGFNPSARLNDLEVRPEISSLSNCSSSGSEKAVLPVMKSQAGSFPLKGSPEAGVKFLGRGDCDSAGPSPSNPILRLMGKNLMVVNKEEDSSVPIGQSPQPCAQSSSHVPSHFPTSSGFSPNNMQNQDCRSFPHMVPQRPVIFAHNPYDAVGQQSFDVRFSGGFKNYSNPRTPQKPAQVSEGLFQNQLINGGFAISMESHMYEGAYSLSSRHNRPKIRSSETSSSSYNMEKDNKNFDHPQNNAADCGPSFKEIIVIEDVPESEANVTGADVAKYSEGLRANPLMISSGISIPTVPGYNSRHVNPFSCYQSQDPSVLGDSPAVVHNSNFHAIPSRLPNASPVRWSCTPEGSGVLQRSPYIPASNSTGHLSSTLYFSPRLL